MSSAPATTVSPVATLPATIAPTLDDAGVLRFCTQGYCLVPGVVPAWVNAKTIAYLDAHPEPEPSGILHEGWFREHVLCQPAAARIIRTLLGPGLALPVLMSSHRRQAPLAATGGWHIDGGSRWRPELQELQVFYYPQDTPEALGPTHLLPGSHLIENAQRAMAHYGAIRGEVSTAAPAGSIIITMYRLWHRASPATGTGVRHLLKYCYARRAAPGRDWPGTPGFDPATASFSGPAAPFGEQFHEAIAAAELFTWLCGQHHTFHHVGGQAWPVPAQRLAPPTGVPAGLTPWPPRGAET